MRISELVGRLGADAELKTSKNGGQFVTMRVASNEFFGGENTTTWVSVIWHGDRAVKMAEYMKKGSQVFVVGKPKATIYTTKSGEAAIDETIYADSVDFVGGGNSGSTASNSTTVTNAATDTGKFEKVEKEKQTKNEEKDDLPF